MTATAPFSPLSIRSSVDVHFLRHVDYISQTKSIQSLADLKTHSIHLAYVSLLARLFSQFNEPRAEEPIDSELSEPAQRALERANALSAVLGRTPSHVWMPQSRALDAVIALCAHDKTLSDVSSPFLPRTLWNAELIKVC